jgi:hypothetical protein
MPVESAASVDAGTSVAGWKTAKGDEITLFSSNFEFDGWSYPSSMPGAYFEAPPRSYELDVASRHPPRAECGPHDEPRHDDE